MKKINILLICLTFAITNLHANTPRILIQIIDSDYCPIDECKIYPTLHSIWTQYMNSDPEHIKPYFTRCNSDLSEEFTIEGDTIWARAHNGWPPHSNGILVKTILAFEAVLPELDEFDYVIRTDLSSFYVLPRLLKFLEDKPRTGFYCGSGEGFASGCGMIISTDLIKQIVKDKQWFFDFQPVLDDDVIIGIYMKNHLIPLVAHRRLDVLNIKKWNRLNRRIPKNVFHVRIKNEKDHALRMTDDQEIYRDLLAAFYPTSS